MAALYRRADQVPGGADDGESDAEQGDLRHPRWTATSQRQPQASDPGQHRRPEQCAQEPCQGSAHGQHSVHLHRLRPPGE